MIQIIEVFSNKSPVILEKSRIEISSLAGNNQVIVADLEIRISNFKIVKNLSFRIKSKTRKFTKNVAIE